MNKKCILVVFVFFSMLVVGCDSFSLPEEMIQKPAMDKRIEVAKEIRDSFPMAYEIILPKNLGAAAALNYADLTGNGKDEMIILYKEKEKLDKHGIKILRKYINTWEHMDEIRGTAIDIKDVHFEDINNDGKDEIIVEWLQENKKINVGIYVEDKEKIYNIYELECDELKIGDLDNDSIIDIVTLNSMEENSIEANLYNFDGRDDPKVNTVIVRSNRKIRTISANFGKVTKDRNGIVLDVPFDANQGYTEILVKDDGKLRTVFSKEDDFGITKSISATNNWDIDNDGIIEINILYEDEDFDEQSNNQNPSIQRWYNWDGDDGLKLKHHVYYDSANGFRFFVPDKWVGNYIVEVNEGSDIQYIFIYEKDKYPIKKTEIARIVIIEDLYLKDFQQKFVNTQREYKTIGKNMGKNYLFSNNKNDDEVKEYLIVDDETIVENFKMLR